MATAETENGFMEPKYLSFRFGGDEFDSPFSSDKVIGPNSHLLTRYLEDFRKTAEH